MLRVHSFETFGTHEGPGIRFVVFLQGCHFRCLYCHNPDTWSTSGGSEYTIESISAKALKEKCYFGKKGGVTVSGGEPLVQRIELARLFALLQKDSIHTALDTNGYFVDDFAKQVLKFTNLALLDVKHIDEKKHQILTGQSNRHVLQFADILREMNVPTWLRYVLVPGITDIESDLHRWGKHFQAYSNVERVEILPYHTLGVYKYRQLGLQYKLDHCLPPSEATIQKTKTIFAQYFAQVTIR